MKKKILVLSGALVFSLAPSGRCVAQVQKAGCRDLSEQIWYDAVPPRNAHYARIAMVAIEGGKTLLVTAGRLGFYGTSDLGAQWSLLSGDIWNPLWHSPEAIGAPSDPRTMYRYEPVGVIERSQDGGKTWVEPQPKIDGASEASTAFRVSGDHTYTLEFEISAIHPLDPLTVYATVKAAPPRRLGGDTREQHVLRGMYVSKDGGENWTRFSDQVGVFKDPRRVVLAISAADPRMMFSEGVQGIVRSKDGGQKWEPVGESELLNLEPLDTEDRANGILVPRKQVPLHPVEFAFDLASSQTIYMVSRKGIHRSLDGGDTWKILNLGFDRLNAVNSFAVDPLQPNRLFVGTDRGLFVSEDRGCAFARVPLPEHTGQ